VLETVARLPYFSYITVALTLLLGDWGTDLDVFEVQFHAKTHFGNVVNYGKPIEPTMFSVYCFHGDDGCW
jgi:hypothetical protein